jgi:hypothetical protein
LYSPARSGRRPGSSPGGSAAGPFGSDYDEAGMTPRSDRRCWRRTVAPAPPVAVAGRTARGRGSHACKTYGTTFDPHGGASVGSVGRRDCRSAAPDTNQPAGLAASPDPASPRTVSSHKSQVTSHEPMVANVQERIESRRDFPAASVDQTGERTLEFALSRGPRRNAPSHQAKNTPWQPKRLGVRSSPARVSQPRCSDELTWAGHSRRTS